MTDLYDYPGRPPAPPRAWPPPADNTPDPVADIDAAFARWCLAAAQGFAVLSGVGFALEQSGVAYGASGMGVLAAVLAAPLTAAGLIIRALT